MATGVFSRPCSYATRALVYLASQPAGRMSAGGEIATSESIPPAFLGKVLHPLCRDRWVRSRKGLNGGYELLVSPERISLLDIIRSVDGEPLIDCLLEDRACSCATPCELHESWAEMRDQFVNYLQRVTVADLASNRQGWHRQNARMAAEESIPTNLSMRRGE
jgi:Rrf2 family transcriptional regulator, iron-sulfur cluster assembly transcription factor